MKEGGTVGERKEGREMIVKMQLTSRTHIMRSAPKCHSSQCSLLILQVGYRHSPDVHTGSGKYGK